MNKIELINKIAEKTGATKVDSKKHLAALLEIIGDTLAEGEAVRLIGFGTFEVRNRKARQGRNPRNPEEIINIPASKAPAFKPGKPLKEMVNN